MARAETDDVGFRERVAFELSAQRDQGLIIADVVGRIDVAIPDAVLQRDAPGPAGLECTRARGGRDVVRSGGCARQRDRAIARQPMAPVDEARLQRALDEQAVESAAV